MKNSYFLILAFLVTSLFIPGCQTREKITTISQLAEKEFAVPTGTVADKLVLSTFPEAKFKYFNSVLDACIAVKTGKADAAAYDEPILRNIAAKNDGLKVLTEMITIDNYGFAVQQENISLKATIDSVLTLLKTDGRYEEMKNRWLPLHGNPAPMPVINFAETDSVLKMGTASVTEPFSYIDASGQVVGLDIEIMSYIAQALGKKLEVVNMDFGAMIPALISGKVDIIGACITITDERAKSVLFSEPYYQGGIAALVKE